MNLIKVHMLNRPAKILLKNSLILLVFWVSVSFTEKLAFLGHIWTCFSLKGTSCTSTLQPRDASHLSSDQNTVLRVCGHGWFPISPAGVGHRGVIAPVKQPLCPYVIQSNPEFIIGRCSHS